MFTVERHVTIMALALLSACGNGATGSSSMDKDIAASIEAFANRKIYAKLDPATLRSIPNADLEQAVIDYVFSKLEKDFAEEAQVVRELSPGLRAMYLTWIVEAEVNNGGFNQYYWNTEEKFASDAVTAFEYFGASEHAALMRDANVVHATEEAEMAKFKEQGSLEAFSESYEHTKLEPLDDRFFQLSENLSRLRIARIRQMPEQFSGE